MTQPTLQELWTGWRPVRFAHGHAQRVFDAYRTGRTHELRWWERFVAGPLQLIILTSRELIRNQVPTLASSLAFFSVLAIVPLLSVVTALLGAFGVFESSGGDLARYLGALFPSSSKEVVAYLREFSVKGAASIGGISGLSLLVIGIALFNNIERALGVIWNGAGERAAIQKFLMFYTMITLGPLLLIMSIVQSANVQIFISAYGVDTSSLSFVLPFFYALIVFAFMNKILPNAHVDWSSALFGGVVTAAAFELAKWGFNQYVTLVVFDSYNRLYGALGLAPIFMVWIYVTWLVILIGSEMAYCYQNMGNLLRLDAPLEGVLIGEGGGRNLYDPVVGVEVFTPVAQAFFDGRGPVSETQIQQATGYSGVVVRDVVERLIGEEFLMVAGKGRGATRLLLPARPLDQIELGELVSAFFVRRSHITDELDELTRASQVRLMDVFEGCLAAELVTHEVDASEMG